jgi:hypothetical protein
MVDTCSLGGLSVCVEARALYEMVVRGTASVHGVRGLICVDPKSETWLRAFALAHPEEAHFVDRALKFRSAVLEVFDALVSDGVLANQSLEVEQAESDLLEEPVAIAQP